jgi:hypothetical protein
VSRLSWFSSILLLALLSSATLAITPAGAAGLHPQGGDALGGINNWYTLQPGQSVEWVFRYPGNDDPALIAFGVKPENALTVNVYDDSQWQDLLAGDTSVVPVGKGTTGTIYGWTWPQYQDLMRNGKVFWEAKSNRGVRFHLHLINPTKQPLQYWIAQAGPGAGPLSSAHAVAAQATEASPAPTPSGAGQAVAAPPYLPASGAAWTWGLLMAGASLVAAGRLLRRTRRRTMMPDVS